MLETIIQHEYTIIAFRLILALVCGAVIGIERGRKNRPAGFRTYMLVCIGAALVMMTNEYIYKLYGEGEPTRMGAQVISGIGFLGAGTIIVTGHNKVKGLTTAAGLWTVACIGLAIGVGFYFGAILGTVMLFFAMSVLHDFDNKVVTATKSIQLAIQFTDSIDIAKLITFADDNNIRLTNMEIDRSNIALEDGVELTVVMQFDRKQISNNIVYMVSQIEGVRHVEEVRIRN